MTNYAQRQFEYAPSYESGYRVRPRAKVPGKKKGISVKNKKRILMLMMALGMLGLSVIMVISYGASVNYRNNQLRDQNAALAGEVETLRINVQSANNITDIERKAKKSLGMVYAEGKKYVVLSSEEKPAEKFASKLKAEAFR